MLQARLGCEPGNNLVLGVDGLAHNLGLAVLHSSVILNAEGNSTLTNASQVVCPVVSWGQGKLLDSHLLEGRLAAAKSTLCVGCVLPAAACYLLQAYLAEYLSVATPCAVTPIAIMS